MCGSDSSHRTGHLDHPAIFVLHPPSNSETNAPNVAPVITQITLDTCSHFFTGEPEEEEDSWTTFFAKLEEVLCPSKEVHEHNEEELSQVIEDFLISKVFR
jgi:hypothetical protein